MAAIIGVPRARTARVVLGAAFGLALVTLLILSAGPSIHLQSHASAQSSPPPPSPVSQTPPKPVRRTRIAIEESAGHHEEVLGALIYSALQLPGAEVTFYRHRYLRFGFDEILTPYFPKPITPLADLYEDLRAEDGARRIDVLVSTTCEHHLPNAGKQLMQAWEARERKFRLLCLIHHANGIEKLEKDLRPWALKGALSLVGLSSHTSKSTERNLGWLMAKPDGVTGVPYDQCPVHTFVPIFPYDLSMETSSPERSLHGTRARVTRAAIQGGINQGRRDYATVFRTLEAEIRADPELWGYSLPEDPTNMTAPFVRDPAVSDPFTLHLIGQGSVEIPGPVSSVVEVHHNLVYPEFYSLLHSMDILIPAFNGGGYYTDAASSSIPAAVIGHVPILVTRMHLNSYTYLDPRGIVVRPGSISDMAAVGLLRRHGTTTPSPPVGLAPDGPELAARSWPRSEAGMEAHRGAIYERNRQVLEDAIYGDLHNFAVVGDV